VIPSCTVIDPFQKRKGQQSIETRQDKFDFQGFKPMIPSEEESSMGPEASEGKKSSVGRIESLRNA
jgi:hypothetical protein